MRIYTATLAFLALTSLVTIYSTVENSGQDILASGIETKIYAENK